MTDQIPDQLKLGQREAKVLALQGCPILVLVDGEVSNLKGPALFDARPTKDGLHVSHNHLR